MTISTFSVGTAIQDALSVLRRYPRRTLLWGLLLSLPSLLVLIATLPIIIEASRDGTAPDMDAGASVLLNAISSLAQVGQLVVLIPAYAALGFMIWGRERAKTWLGLRFGMDEVRVLLVFLAIVAGAFIVAMAATVIVALIAVPVGMIARPAGVLVGIVLAIAVGCGIVWAMVRTLLMIPASLDLQKFAFVEGWRATKGHFWPLLGTGLLAMLVMAAISIMVVLVLGILMILGIALAYMLSGGEPQTLPAGLWVALGIPAFVVLIVVSAVYSAVQIVLSQGPWYSVWQQLNRTVAAPADIQPRSETTH